jgi:plasmid stabilization system protein ParE
MRAYALTPLAKADIFDIWAYVADDNDDAADVESRRSMTLQVCGRVAVPWPLP